MRKLDIADNYCFLVISREDRKYFCGFDIAEGYLVLSKTPTYFVDARYFYAVKEEIEKAGIKAVLLDKTEDIFSYIKGEFSYLYLDYEKTSVSFYNKIKSFNIEILDGNSILSQKKAVKDEAEIDSIEKACKITQDAYYYALKKVKKGITEKELANILTEYMLNNGAEELSFDMIVAFGAESAIPHHETSDKVLEYGMPVLIDMGCKVNGYCSDYTRTFYFGDPTEKFVKVYEAVKEANILAEKEIKAGFTTDRADAVARDYLNKKGYEGLFTHSLGHGIGALIHEYPSLSYRSKEELKENMVFSIEPGVYINGEFGVRIEDTVVIKNGLITRLFTDSKDLIVIK